MHTYPHTLPLIYSAGILQTEDGGDNDALTKLFCRIDANSDGTIDWDEFSQFMLLENQARVCACVSGPYNRVRFG
jgi:hypothetical protein